MGEKIVKWDLEGVSNFGLLKQKAGCIISRDKIKIETFSKEEIIPITEAVKKCNQIVF